MFKTFAMLLGVCVLSTRTLCAADSVKSDDDAVHVQVVGTLRIGVIAIGGETTGIVVQSKKITWELEFAENSDLKKAAEKLNGKRVSVEGSLERRVGVEVKERWIVTATKLQSIGE